MEDISISFYSEREAIMAAACAFSSQSNIRIGRRELARRAGVTTATLQRHFRSLADLQAEFIKLSASHSMAETDSAENRVDG